jgi:hypothetical protein
MIYEVFDAFRSAGVEQSKARAAAEAMAKYDAEIAGMRGDISGMRGDVALLKRMFGFGLALNVTIILKLSIH